MNDVCFIIQSTIVGDWSCISTSMEADIYQVACEPLHIQCSPYLSNPSCHGNALNDIFRGLNLKLNKTFCNSFFFQPV